MMTAAQHPLVTGYLAALQQEAVHRLPADRAHELVADIESDLAERLGPDATEVDIRNALERLGTPAELVDEAGGAPAVAPIQVVAPRSVTLERWALGLLITATVATVTVVFSPFALPAVVVGLILTMVSSLFTGRDKVLAAIAYVVAGPPLVALGGLAAVMASSTSVCVDQADTAGTVVGQSCTGSSSGITFLGVLVLSVMVAGVALQIWTIIRFSHRIKAAQAS